jgi:hypothetical protein
MRDICSSACRRPTGRTKYGESREARTEINDIAQRMGTDRQNVLGPKGLAVSLQVIAQ